MKQSGKAPMTKRETISLLIKLIGIYCLVQFVPSLIYVLGFMKTMRDSHDTWIKLFTLVNMTLTPAIWVGFCILIIRSSDKIAQRLYREDADVPQLCSLGFQDVQVLGYNFIGLILLVQSCPRIINIVATIKTEQMYDAWSKEDFHLNTLPYLLSFLTQFILGLVLFLKPKGLANLWKKAQGMKHERAKPAN